MMKKLSLYSVLILCVLQVLCPGCARNMKAGRFPPPRPVVSRKDMFNNPIPVEFRCIDLDIKEFYTGALLAKDGKIYMAVSRKPKPAQLVVYDPETDSMKAAVTFTSGALCGGPDGKPLPPGTNPVLKGEDRSGMSSDEAWFYSQDKVHARLYQGADGRIYGATDSGVGDEHPDNTRRYAGGHFFAFDPETGKVEDLGWARRHEGIIAIAMDIEREIIYGVTWPSGQLYACHIKVPEKGPRIKLLDLTTNGLQGVPRYCDILKDGRVFMCNGTTGDILVYIPPDYKGIFKPEEGLSGRLNRPAGLVTPTRPDPVEHPSLLRRSGRFRNWWMNGTLSPDGMRIYTTSQRRGQLFEIEGTAGIFGRVIDHPHAKPWSGYGGEWTGASIKIMTFAKNGKFFYTGSGHLLTYDPRTGEIRDWGYMVDRSAPGKSVSKLGCGLTSVAADGTFYFTATRRGPLIKAAEKEGEKPKYEYHYGLAWFNPQQLTQSKLQYTELHKKTR